MDPAPPVTPETSAVGRQAFRFGAVYFALYALPFPFDALPGFALLAGLYTQLWNAAIPWVGKHVLGIGYEIAVGPNGSGDTTADYVRLLMVLVLAVLGSAAWGLLDRRRQHPRLAAWITVWARYWLATYMISYGFAKVFCLQFPEPGPFRLLEPYGESSPMGLVWTFMGQSPAYQAFTGSAEVLGGMLLLWRRTTTLGALVTAGVMTNVVMLNFGYDIPVKLFSTHLLAVALVLVSPDAPRLLGMLLGRAVPAREVPPVLDGRWGRRVRLGLKVAFIGLLLLFQGLGSWQAYHEYGRGAPMSPLQGAYEVVAHELDGNDQSGPQPGPQPVIDRDERSWRHVAFGQHGRLAMWPIHGESIRYRVTVDEQAGTIEVTPREPDGEPQPQTLRFHRLQNEPGDGLGPDAGALVIEGTLDGVAHRVTLRRIDQGELRLPSRGFHWINEQPFNR